MMRRLVLLLLLLPLMLPLVVRLDLSQRSGNDVVDGGLTMDQGQASAY